MAVKYCDLCLHETDHEDDACLECMMIEKEREKQRMRSLSTEELVDEICGLIVAEKWTEKEID